ncbi:MAG: DUF6273 domain-containing protein [Aristaeellaceae bacterium]
MLFNVNRIPWKNLQPGQEVTFGRYPQGAGNEVQPIAWQVLEVRDDRALLLSRYVLDAQPFYTEAGITRWIDATVRQWLQETFTPAAFTRQEQKLIWHPAPKADPNEDFLDWLRGEEERIDDPVFVLSQGEVLQYFPSENGLFCTGASAAMTPWAEANFPDVYQVDGKACWWLRNTFNQMPFAFIVSPVDSIGASMIDPHNCQGVRPALWVRLK